jgi:carboxyl-terminal processing protease
LSIRKLYSPSVNQIKEKVIPRLKKKKTPLVLDLRNCSEGSIEGAQKLTNLFLRAKNIGYFEKRGLTTEYLSCLDPAVLEKFPMVVWTNRATIGPAEIVVGVLKKYKRAKIIGTKTPGLTARQDLFRFKDGSGLLLTTAVFRLGKDSEFWQNGVKPDIELTKVNADDSSYLKNTSKNIP